MSYSQYPKLLKILEAKHGLILLESELHDIALAAKEELKTESCAGCRTEISRRTLCDNCSEEMLQRIGVK